MKLLIDGDALIYPILMSNLNEVLMDDEVAWATLDVDLAYTEVAGNIARYCEAAGTEEHLVAFSCPSSLCFRRDYAPTYKANRSGVKPLGFSPLIAKVKAHHKSLVWDRLEADDILGILQSQPTTDTMIVGVDKDFATVPGRVMHPGKLSVETFTEEEADQNHLRQTLTGDSTDGYPGAKGFGPKKVDALGYLTWEKVVEAFQGDEEAALTQARLARILRWGDWDAVKKEPIPWKPA